MFFSVLFCTVRLSIFERFVFASFEPLRFCKKVRFVFPDLQIYPIYLFGYRKIPQRAYFTAVFFCVCRESKERK